MKKIICIISILLCSLGLANAEIKEITSVEANAVLKEGHDFVVLDVRTDEEFKEGHIRGALNIDIRQPDFFEKIDKLDRKAKYIVYCRTGNRSLRAADYMMTKGFANLYHIIDGFIGWSQNGLPVEK